MAAAAFISGFLFEVSVRARVTTRIRHSASSRPRKPAAATGIHGTPWRSRVWYQPCPAITGTTQALTAFIFAGSDVCSDIAGESAPVQRFRQPITTMATIALPA